MCAKFCHTRRQNSFTITQTLGVDTPNIQAIAEPIANAAILTRFRNGMQFLKFVSFLAISGSACTNLSKAARYILKTDLNTSSDMLGTSFSQNTPLRSYKKCGKLTFLSTNALFYLHAPKRIWISPLTHDSTN